MRITFLGHATFYVEGGGVRLIIDPFLTGNPKAARKAEDIKVDYVILTHGHQDHTADAVAIAKANDATVISTFEVAEGWAQPQGVKVHPVHLGGKVAIGDGYARCFQAFHGAGVPGGHAAGFVIRLGGKSFYHAGDTALFSDMKLLNGVVDTVDVAALPIGDNFTMGPDDAVVAAQWIGPKVVVPMHYGTFPLIEVDVEAFKRKVEASGIRVAVLEPGQSLDV